MAKRFLYIYFLLYFLPMPAGFRDGVVAFLAQKILSVSIDLSTATFGSVDRVADYAWIAFSILASVIISSTWHLVDRRRPLAPSISYWGLWGIRVFLAWTMIAYGAIKIVPSQFPEISLTRLIEPYGHSSPMALLWTFMGASRTYQIITGALELICGFFLLIPQLQIVGTLIALGATLNILALNLSYDVPVKTYSIHLVLASLAIISPNIQSLFRFFIQNQAVKLSLDLRPSFSARWSKLLVVVPLAVGIWILGSRLQGTNNPVDVPLRGIWVVEKVENQPSFPWTQIVFDRPTLMAAQHMDGAIELIKIEDIDPEKFLTIRKKATGWKTTFQISRIDQNAMQLKAPWDGHEVVLHLRKRDPSEFLLINRGFHWINEAPFNE